MWIFLTRLLKERESHKRCERKWGSEDVFSSSALLLCALTHNVFPKTRQSIISEWSDYINCCVAVSDKQSCQRSMLQITLGHHQNLLYWTHLARWAVLCVLISSQRVFVSFFLLPGSAARHTFEYFLKYRSLFFHVVRHDRLKNTRLLCLPPPPP